MANIGLKGGKALQDALNSLPVKMEKNILRAALSAGARVILAEAKNNVPVDSGDLRDSLRVSSRARKGQVTASVKSGNKKVWYSNLIEYGVAPHSINAGKGFLSFGGVFTKSVQHPGFRAKPFLRPALDAKSNEAIEVVGQYIGKRLTKQGLNQPPTLEIEKE